MTNDAPERIWADPPEVFYGCDVWHSEPAAKRTEYIRADQAKTEQEAAVAAEREACAEVVWHECYPSTNQGSLSEMQLAEADTTEIAIKAIRDRANTAPLAARDARVRAEALMEAAAQVRDELWNRLGDHKVCDQASKAILDLIPADQEEDK